MKRLGDVIAGNQTLASNTSSDAEADLPVEREPPQCALCNDGGFVRLDREVGDPEFGAVVPCACARRRGEFDQSDRLQRYANLGPLVEFTFEFLRGDGAAGLSEAIETAQAFARREVVELVGAPATPDLAPGWLVVWGGVGGTKTALGAAMANERIARGEAALYFVVPDLLDHLRAAYGKDADMPFPLLFEKVRSAPFLILDDIDAANLTPWAEEKLFQLLNYRESTGLPTAVLSGQDPESLPGALAALLRRFAGPHVIALPTSAAGSAAAGQDEPRGQYKQIGGMGRSGLDRYDFEGFRVEGYGLSDDEAENLALVRAVCRDWAAAPKGWMTLVGETGTGKTHLAAATARLRLEEGDTVFFAVVPDLLDHLRRTYNPNESASFDDVFDDLRAADLLVLDDLGAHSTTAWAQEKLYQLFSYRYLQAKPTVITTNLNPEELDPRLASRLLDHEIGQVYRLDTRDHRTGTRAPTAAPARRRDSGRKPTKWDTPRW
ncbi:MAG TPA: ATP-binding protein [Dehalococcoidia bacterium]|nr:ATP-binding protein [Dehalococcoidia bacterium]